MRFCQYCGARLEDGQECTCPQAQQERQAKESQQGQDFQGYSFQQSYCYQHGYSTQQPPSQPESPEEQGSQEQGQQAQQGQPFAQVGKQVRDTTAQAAKSLKPFFAQYWKNPVEAVRAAVENKNITLAVTLSVIRLLTVILLVLRLSAAIKNTVMEGLSFLGSILSMAGLGYGSSGSPLLCILYGILIAVLGVALFTVTLFCSHPDFQERRKLLGMFIANSANGIIVTALMLVALILSFLSLSIALGLVVMACLSAVLMGGLSARAVCPGQDSGVFLLTYLGCVLVVLIISWLIVPDILLQAVAAMF